MSLGEDRVRVKFNTEDRELVSLIKQWSAQLIDLCEQSKFDRGASVAQAETLRLWSLAQTAYEEAAMWATKAATA